MSFLLTSLNNDQLLYSLNLKSRAKLIIKLEINNYLSLLPPELIHEIIQFLDIEELFNICQLNSNYQYLCSDSYIINKVSRKSLDSYYDKFNILEMFLKYRRDLTENELNKTFISASRYGHLEVVRLLLQDSMMTSSSWFFLPSEGRQPRVNPAARDNEAIVSASMNGHLEVVRLLLQDSRIDPRFPHNHAILYASRFRKRDVVELLLQDPRVNPEHVTYEEFEKIR